MAGISTVMDRRIDLHLARQADHHNPGRSEVQAFLDRLSARYSDLIAAALACDFGQRALTARSGRKPVARESPSR